MCGGRPPIAPAMRSHPNPMRHHAPAMPSRRWWWRRFPCPAAGWRRAPRQPRAPRHGMVRIEPFQCNSCVQVMVMKSAGRKHAGWGPVRLHIRPQVPGVGCTARPFRAQGGVRPWWAASSMTRSPRPARLEQGSYSGPRRQRVITTLQGSAAHYEHRHTPIANSTKMAQPLRPFGLERYLAPREFKAKHALCCSDAESWSMSEIMDQADDDSKAR